MVHIDEVLSWALAQDGDPYVFGAKGLPTDADPEKFDCSGLTKWATDRAGVDPPLPHGAYYQWVHTRQLAVPVPTGIDTRGALLFVGDGSGVGRDAITHVAWSLGDGTTIEARGSKWGVGIFTAEGRFNYAARIPGVDYSPPPTPPPPLEEDDMPLIIRAEDSDPMIVFGDEAIAGVGDTDRKKLEDVGVHSVIISKTLRDRIAKKLNAEA